jgi:hypothetical protein
VTRNQWRDEMIKRGVARYNWQTGKWEWEEPQALLRRLATLQRPRPPLPATCCTESTVIVITEQVANLSPD